MNDDPREVLALLNSLGFVGITAPQLKAFMKDLKLYRKVKERERLQRKEEIKKKIITKQESMIKEILRERYEETNVPSEDSEDFYADDSLVKVRVRCVSEDETSDFRDAKENDRNVENVQRTKTCVGKRNSPLIQKSDKLRKNRGSAKYSPTNQPKSESLVEDRMTRSTCSARHKTQSEQGTREETSMPEDRGRHSRSRTTVAGQVQDRVGSVQTRSTSSGRQSTRSGSKSFIRPWRLQPDAQKNGGIKKSDPVALYQKYQQDWKQMSFPGEAKHAGIRWAVRERMLGSDPHPVPLPKRS